MKLSDLSRYNPITIQCHDNPDPDTVASGYALYTYFKSLGKEVSLLYSGRNKIQKPNLRLMLENLEIPLVYEKNPGNLVKDAPEQKLPGLLLTVDCQYGAGNVTKIPAETAAVIDHHQVEIRDLELCEINPGLGSCSTLVWSMLKEEGFWISDSRLGTALYYGLYTDTNQFSEIFNPLDMDMREELPVEKSLIQLFRNSNLSLRDLETAGIALIRYIYNEDYQYAIIRSQPCDPNILGLISDLLLQVAEVHTCVVYNECGEGIKFSVRSCIKEVQASELAAYLAEGIGSGGGHHEKAGGFISQVLYEEEYPTLHTEAFFSERLNNYFDNCRIFVGGKEDMDVWDMHVYRRKCLSYGYVQATDILPAGTPITLRTLEGDKDMRVEPDLVFRIGLKGEVRLEKSQKFDEIYERTEEAYRRTGLIRRLVYRPTVRSQLNGRVYYLTDYARVCRIIGDGMVYARELTGRIKLFPTENADTYHSGKQGDFLVAEYNDLKNVSIVERNIFAESFTPQGKGILSRMQNGG